MTRRFLIASLAVAGALAAGFGIGFAQTPPPDAKSSAAALGMTAGEPSRVVPHDKFVRAVEGWRDARAQVRSLRRSLSTSPSVQEAMAVASVAYAVPLSEMRSVAWCESRHTPDARNGQYRGLYQFGPIFDSTPYGRAGLSVWSPIVASMAAAYIVRHGGRGWSPWECSPRGAFRP